MKLQIRNFDFTYWDEFRELIQNHWRDDHPVINKDLFTWQYRGFGSLSTCYSSKLLFSGDELIGFRGVTPGVYQFIQDGSMQIIPGAAFTLSIIKPEYRGGGGYFNMFREIANDFGVLEALGANRRTTAPIYKKLKFTNLDRLNRYILPLDIEGYTALLEKDADMEVLKTWVNEIHPYGAAEPIPFDPSGFEQLWLHSTEDVNLFSLHRNADFWRWRYQESKGFSYVCFGDINRSGLVIARVEPVIDARGNNTDQLKVLRIIEIIPYNRQVWNGQADERLQKLITGVLAWGRNKGCCAADFQCSTNRFEKLLFSAGFKLQRESESCSELSLATLFQPLSHSKAPINAMWRIEYEGSILHYDANDTYIVKSNGDMDRPNILET